jgi:probable F420-dependent oxidoreductase
MNIGAIYPQIEFSHDPSAIREYVQTAEALGYKYIMAYDHVVGVNPDRPGGWKGTYDYQDPFMEPFLLFSYMTAFTTRLGFATGVIILPQRETVLVAKQAATLDVLCGGRLRLGVATGWNEPEYVAQGKDFHTRGKRIAEQVEVMRLLWSNKLVTFDGEDHHLPDVGINPLPIQRPIPIWMGGYDDRALKRIARLADGWISSRPAESASPMVEKLLGMVEEAGRSRSDFGIEGRINFVSDNPETWNTDRAAWESMGATYLSINTMGAGFDTPQKHMDGLRKVAEAFGLK